MKPILFVAPQAGLCNRMRTMIGAIELSKRINSKLVFFWERNKDLNAPFKSLFQDFPYKVIEFKEGSKIQSLLYKVLGKLSFVIGDDYVRANCKKDDISWLNGISSHILFLVTCEQIYPSKDYSIFKIKESLKKVVSNLNGEKTIGVHIRRTDNQPSITYSPTSLFISTMEHCIQNDPEVNFFLSTDDAMEENILRENFGDRITTYEKRSIRRDTQDGIEDAMIDLFLLSQCRCILASYYSSFSDVAAMWGGITKTVIIKRNETY